MSKNMHIGTSSKFFDI